MTSGMALLRDQHFARNRQNALSSSEKRRKPEFAVFCRDSSAADGVLMTQTVPNGHSSRISNRNITAVSGSPPCSRQIPRHDEAGIPSPSGIAMSNIAARLTTTAATVPDGIAVVEPQAYDAHGKRIYRTVSFRELDNDSSRIAGALCELGVQPGTRLALLVRPGIDFIALVFALFKARAVAILIDPGMGRLKLVRCLAEAQPEGFIAIPAAHAVRVLLGHRFPKARLNVTVGKRWFWGGSTLRELRDRNCPLAQPTTVARGPGGDYLHHRQHRAVERRALLPSEFQRPGRRDPRVLWHPIG